jgi:hypothetical protein
MILLVALALLAIALAARFGYKAWWRYRIASELRRDWWPKFERELHDYASRAWEAARDAERHTY